MAKGSSVVEINGNRYDAVTGRLLGAVRQVASSGTQVIDGFTRRPTAKPSPAKKVATTPRPKQTAQTVHQKTQRSRTVMRSIVSRPKIKLAQKPKTDTKPQARRSTVSSTRAFRAKTILRHPNIKHFAKKAEEGEVLPPAAARMAGGQTQALTRPMPNIANALSHNQLERMLDHALERADAHKQALRTRARGPMKLVRRLPRWLNSLIAFVLIVGVGGFVAWQKVPALSLKLASARAHVNATAPSYIPAGYSLAGPAHYNNGSVTIELRSTTDKYKTLTITQQKSSMDSDALKSNSIPANAPVQTSEANGAPLYIYGKGNDAVFKKGDTKVKIDNNADLPPNELSNIAKSLD